MTIFVDTSALYAVADRSDAWHRDAVRVLRPASEQQVTTDVVINELWALMRRRAGRKLADRLLARLVDRALRIESVTRGDLARALEIGEEFPDQDFSLADRTSFAVMHRLGLGQVATFDRHFTIYRFGPDRRRSFEIVR